MLERTEKPYIDIELFPCSGGLAEGHAQAGIHFDLAIEYMADHCDSYENNIGHRPMQMDARDFLQLLEDGWKPPKPVRYLCADPPCTPWSRAGKRLGQEDPRDMLWGTCQIIRHLRPQAYLIGNVPGLDDGPNLPIVQKTIGSLSELGYCTADFARLNAVFYGVPQQRIRPWWFGHLEGPCIQWPLPTHCDPEDDQRGLQVVIDAVKLTPWITCEQALSFLPPDEIGRPIKLRRRAANSAQHGTVPEKPARVVGTSNLSDGNVILPPGAPRAGKRGKPVKNHGTPQGERTTPTDHPSPTITKALHHTIITPVEPLTLELTSAPGSRYRKEDDKRVRQADRVGNAQQPSVTITAKVPRSRAGAHATIDASTFTIQERRGGKDGLNTLNKPAHAIVKNTHGNGSVIVTSKHPAIAASSPATTIRGGGEGHSAPPVVLENFKHPPSSTDQPARTIASKERQSQVLQYKPNHPPSQHDEPAMTQRAQAGGGATRALAWPWNRPSTTVLADERLSPPGHHDESYAIMKTDGDGIVISERAAAILQGFPDTIVCGCGKRRVVPWENTQKTGDLCPVCGVAVELQHWLFAGKTKKARFSQIGQAMPPPFAFAVASSVVAQFAKTEEQKAADKAFSRFRHEMRLNLANYRCTACDARMTSYAEFPEYQHANCVDHNGGLVIFDPIASVDAPDPERGRIRDLASSFNQGDLG